MQIHPEASSGSVIVDGVEVFFHDTGVPGDGRSTIALIHGTGGSTELHFSTLFPMLAARHRVIGIDLQAEKGTVELGDLVAQAAAVLRERMGRRAVALVGYSLGAVVAARLVAGDEHHVDSLVLVAGWITTDAQQRLRNNIWRRLYDSDQPALKEYMTFTSYGSRFLATRSEKEVAALIDRRKLTASLPAMMELNRRIDIASTVEAIAAPTLIVGATYDQSVPIRHSHQLFGAIDNARFVEISTGHAVPTENPAQLFKLIDDFVTAPASHPAGTVLPSIPV
ncbi:alpha/beta fold hydrolase [Arthrobacter sp. KNU40]|uniref:alpha/beta fold hydrolase n=1 Tax=Arthrobacter sp. KNU40 TaxID=3447965 RepID=UPI003F5F220F